VDDLLKTAADWVAGEKVRIRSKRTFYVAVAISLVTFVIGFRNLRALAHPLTHAKPLAPLPADQGDTKWGMSLASRKHVFAEFAAAEPAARVEGARAFPGPALLWSAEDHRGAFERNKARELAGKYRVNLTQIYLCLDEGIREGWPGPDGKPLDPHTVPLNPRRKYDL
jgi:hypothetical protein